METPVRFVRNERPAPFDARRDVRPGAPASSASSAGAAPARPAFTHLEGRLRVFATEPSRFFEAGFNEVHARRMRGLPITDERFRIRVAPFRRAGRHWIGVVVTPWSVQAVLASGDREAWRSLPAGVTGTVELPGGEFTFLGVRDSILGEYQTSPLKSPVSDFEDQRAAEAFADACLDLMATASGRAIPEEKEEGGSLAAPEGEAKGMRPDKAQAESGEPERPAPKVTRRGLFARYLEGGRS